MAADTGTITEILTRRGRDAESALTEAIAHVYADLRRIAGRLMRHERHSPTFDAETLVHEAYLRLARQDRTDWRNRDHLFAVAARIMRRLLVDRARLRATVKRGGDQRRATTTLEGKAGAMRGGVSPDRRVDVLALDEALERLRAKDPRLAQLVELRFFGGMSNPEIAAIQQVTTMTVIRRWRLARAWLHRHWTARDPRDADGG